MPSINNLQLASRAASILSDARREIRDTCAAYKARLDATEWTAAYVRAQTNATGQSIVTRLQTKLLANQASILTALADWSIPSTELTAKYTLLRDAAVAMRDATSVNVSATLTQILSQVAEEPTIK